MYDLAIMSFFIGAGLMAFGKKRLGRALLGAGLVGALFFVAAPNIVIMLSLIFVGLLYLDGRLDLLTG